MPRRPRLDFAGAFHHVTNRGNQGAAIFRDDGDRRLFLALLAEAVARHGWRCHGYCLMGNHYHLLLETPEATLSRGMQWLSAVSTQRFNRARGVSGHLYQGRFHSTLLERDSHLLEAVRYLALNPVRAGLVARAEEWEWSHHRALAGLAPAADFLSRDWLWDWFAPTAAAARRVYADFVAEAEAGPESWTPALAAAAPATPTPPSAPPPGDPEPAAANPRDAAWMARAHFEHGHSQTEIARRARVHQSTVSRAIRRHRATS